MFYHIIGEDTGKALYPKLYFHDIQKYSAQQYIFSEFAEQLDNELRLAILSNYLMNFGTLLGVLASLNVSGICNLYYILTTYSTISLAPNSYFMKDYIDSCTELSTDYTSIVSFPLREFHINDFINALIIFMTLTKYINANNIKSNKLSIITKYLFALAYTISDMVFPVKQDYEYSYSSGLPCSATYRLYTSSIEGIPSGYISMNQGTSYLSEENCTPGKLDLRKKQFMYNLKTDAIKNLDKYYKYIFDSTEGRELFISRFELFFRSYEFYPKYFLSAINGLIYVKQSPKNVINFLNSLHKNDYIPGGITSFDFEGYEKLLKDNLPPAVIGLIEYFYGDQNYSKRASSCHMKYILNSKIIVGSLKIQKNLNIQKKIFSNILQKLSTLDSFEDINNKNKVYDVVKNVVKNALYMN